MIDEALPSVSEKLVGADGADRAQGKYTACTCSVSRPPFSVKTSFSCRVGSLTLEYWSLGTCSTVTNSAN